MKIKIKDDYENRSIKLNSNLVETGGITKQLFVISKKKLQFRIKKREKIRVNDIVSYNGQNITVVVKCI